MDKNLKKEKREVSDKSLEFKLFFGKDENYLINALNEMLIDGMKWY